MGAPSGHIQRLLNVLMAKRLAFGSNQRQNRRDGPFGDRGCVLSSADASGRVGVVCHTWMCAIFGSVMGDVDVPFS